ncbi:MAG TPA: site-specific integrase, partial [Galbitalea sp.]
MASIQKRPNGTWRARYRDTGGKEHARHFRFKDNPRDPQNSAQHWLDKVTADVVTGNYVDPRHAKTTMGEWTATWLRAYEANRPSTVRQARVHIKVINATFGE